MKKTIIITVAVLLVIGLALVVIPTTRDEIHWRWTSHKNETASYESYIKAWPQGRHSIEAIARYDEYAWMDAKLTNTVEGYNRYVQIHGEGKYIDDAKDNIELLHWQEASEKNNLGAYKMFLIMHSDGRLKDKAVSKILDFLSVKCSVIDKETFLVTSGWDYRKDMKIGYPLNIMIKEIENGVFTTSDGMAFIPLCMESEERKQKRKTQKSSGGFYFEALTDVIGVKWIFNKRGIIFDVGGCEFMPLISGATVEFLVEGVRLKGFQIALPAPEGKIVPILKARFSNIFDAAEAGDTATVGELIHSDSKLLSVTNAAGYMALHVAAIEGHTDVVELLLASGADINRPSASDESGRSTPLHCAAYYGQLDVVQLLLSKGANIEAKEINGCTPLHIASFMGQNKVVEFLISKGANLEAKDERNRTTPLLWAVAAGKIDVVETLLSKGAAVNTKDTKGETPLSVATQMKNQDIAILLERHGATK
ncbi:MAG: ankyrin repeat domain-containing protein [Bacteroidales bacterium]|nr:ankyrin repeat domain-containing protein [Bacteroidales bacterium]